MPCRVDAHGILPEELPGDLKLLYTTPAHQYPLGGRLPVSRRQALIAWARATGALVVEDDYDSEFRYDVGPLPALHSMDPDVIVYLGTASKVLATAFGAGWLVAPPGLVERAGGAAPAWASASPSRSSTRMLALLRSGDLERHIRKMRLEYARRRAALVYGLTHPGPGAAAAPRGTLSDALDPAPARSGSSATPPACTWSLSSPLATRGPPGRGRAARGIVVYSLDRYFGASPR